MEAINNTPLDIKKVKRVAAKNPGYEATHYLCLVPERPVSGVFAQSYRQVTKRDTHPAYWAVFDTKQNGYRIATEKYPIQNTESEYPKALLAA